MTKFIDIEFDSLSTIDPASLRQEFDKAGCLIIRNVMKESDIAPIKNTLFKFFQYILQTKGVELQSDNLDVAFNSVFEQLGEEQAKFLLTIGKDLPEYRHLAMHPNILSLAKLLLDTELLQSAEDNNVMRIDRPGKNMTNLPWHQDYPYNMLTKDQVTFWAPLLPVEEEMGRLSVVTPRHELLDIEYSLEEKKVFQSSNYIKLKNLQQLTLELDSQATQVPEVRVGDVFILHGMLLHKSGHNHSTNSRWVMTSRFGALDRQEMMDRNWFTMRAKYPDLFTTIHPEKCHFV